MNIDLTDTRILEMTEIIELDALKAYIYYTQTGLKKEFNEASKIANKAYTYNPTSVITNLVLSAIYQTLAQKSDKKEYFVNQQTYHFNMALEYNDFEEKLFNKMKKTIFQTKTKALKATTPKKVILLKEQYPEALFYDTSTNAPYSRDYSFVENLSEFSPFTQHIEIPVPKQNTTSQSVEGVWQGLKIIKGKIDRTYFENKGRKRYGKATGHLYGDTVIGYVDARKKIYTPSYEYMLTHAESLQEKIELLRQRALNGKQQFLFDVDNNIDIYNTKGPLAHSAILVEYINKTLTQP